MRNFLNVKEVAERYGFKKQSIYNMVCQKRIPSIKVGGALRFDESELAEWEKHTKAIEFANV
jgi:excisionase family DNA binding protein